MTRNILLDKHGTLERMDRPQLTLSKLLVACAISALLWWGIVVLWSLA